MNLLTKYKFRREWKLPTHRVVFEWRDGSSLMGRFGGGWDWELGIQASNSGSFIVNLLVCYVGFYRRTKNDV